MLFYDNIYTYLKDKLMTATDLCQWLEIIVGSYSFGWLPFYPENRKWGFQERLLVLWHFCGVPHLLCKIRKSKDYNFTIYYIDLEKIL